MNALVLGGIAWNTMVYLDGFPEPRPQTLFPRDVHRTVGSSGAGKALNLRRLGADVTLWGLLGSDEAGDRVRTALTSKGIRLMTQTDPLGTMQHLNLMERNGERISIFVTPGSHDFAVDTFDVVPAAADADIVAVTILNYCRQFLPMLQALDKRIWVDIHDYDGVDPYHHEFIEAADYLMMSSVGNRDWLPFLESRVAAGTEVAICTHGARGASGLTAADGWVEMPALPVDAVDTNGAGDAFFAGFAAAWIGGAGLEAAMSRGTHMAAAAVQSRELAPN